jgi:tetratricopeptide (TPR) repeat protein
MTLTRQCIIYLSFLLTSCEWTYQCTPDLNQLPEYGRQKKCEQEIAIDNEFILTCDTKFKDRKTAAKYYIKRAWDYFEEGKMDTAMFRFNQAWMLDSTNADIYWGFGNLLGTKKQFKESILFFNKSIKLNPNNATVWECVGKSYGQLFFLSKKVDQLDTCIDYLKHSLQLDPTNARVYGQLTASYSYFMQKDSALKYLAITDKLDSSAVNPEVRAILTNN